MKRGFRTRRIDTGYHLPACRATFEVPSTAQSQMAARPRSILRPGFSVRRSSTPARPGALGAAQRGQQPVAVDVAERGDPHASTTLISTARPNAVSSRCANVRTSTIPWITPASTNRDSDGRERREAADDRGEQPRPLAGLDARGGGPQREHQHGDPASHALTASTWTMFAGRSARPAPARSHGRRARGAARARRAGTSDRDGAGPAGAARAGAAARPRAPVAAAPGRRSPGRRARGRASGAGRRPSPRAELVASATSDGHPGERGRGPRPCRSGCQHLVDDVAAGRVPERAALADGALEHERGGRSPGSGRGAQQPCDADAANGPSRRVATPRPARRAGQPAPQQEDSAPSPSAIAAYWTARGDGEARCR